MMRRTAMLMMVGAMVFTLVPAASASDVGIAQPTELFPPDDEVPILYPPDSELMGHADLVLLVDRGSFDRSWREVRAVIDQAGGRVIGASASIGEYEGRTYEFGTVELQIPNYLFEDALSWFSELGRPIAADIGYEATRGPEASIVITMTEEAGPFYGSPGPGSDGRIGQALDTAGDVLLTIAAVLIVAGAVIIPIGVLALVAYAVWRAARRRWPIAEPGMALDGSSERDTSQEDTSEAPATSDA